MGTIYQQTMRYRSIVTIIAILITIINAFSQTEFVRTHDELTIVTNPKQGINSFIGWGSFPSESKEIRSITMNLTLAYPKDRAIAHWDYLDRVNILRQGGVDGKLLDFEIGRMLTPYGSNFKEGWAYTWSVDITDFQAFLRDSVEIEYIHSGYESPDLGWDLTIEFEIVFGPPVADFIKVDKMWNGGFQYGNPENDIENSLVPLTIKKAEEATFGRFRIQHTGHGMDQPNGCSEFCSRWRELLFDGRVIDRRNIWKECGDNPLYPQGGTWIFDRGYWCPGDLQAPDIIDMPLTKNVHTVDLNMEPFTANNVDQPKEQISSYYFQYGKPNNENDVTVEEIISPNKRDNYNRFNPSGFDPIIKIRNLGSNTLRAFNITYFTEGFEPASYLWHGALDFYESAYITLPGKINAKNGENTFTVILDSPNGVTDQWDADNSMSSEFYDIPTIPLEFVVDFMTNNKPGDNTLAIVNSKHDTVFLKTPETLEAATTYLDTLRLPEDNYYMMLSDTAGDGLEFWFMARSGYGRLRLKDTKGNLISLFESDCGSGIFFSFRTNDEIEVDTNEYHLSVNIFPRMVRDSLTIYTTTNKESVLKIVITRDGAYLETHEYTGIKDSETGLNLSHLPEGRYVMEIYHNGEHKMNRRFNKVSSDARR
jgi:hypothetical protein